MKEVLLELQLAGTVSATRSRGPDPSSLALTTYFRAPFYPRMGAAVSPSGRSPAHGRCDLPMRRKADASRSAHAREGERHDCAEYDFGQTRRHAKVSDTY